MRKCIFILVSVLLVSCNYEKELTLFHSTMIAKNSLIFVNDELIVDSTKNIVVQTTIFTSFKNDRDTLKYKDTLEPISITGVSFSRTVDIRKNSFVTVLFEYSDSTYSFFSLDKFNHTDVFITQDTHFATKFAEGNGFYIRRSRKNNFDFR